MILNIQDIRVVCNGTKSYGHEETGVGLIGWNPDAKRPEDEFIAYFGETTDSGRPRAALWAEGRPIKYGMMFKFVCNAPRCTRKQPLSFTTLRQYARALEAAQSSDTRGRLTLNLTAPPTIGSSS